LIHTRKSRRVRNPEPGVRNQKQNNMKNLNFPDNYTPRGIVFIPTYNCTAMCRHCNNDFAKHDLAQKMDIKRAVELLYEAKKLGLNSIQITGGEITMYPEFMLELIPHAKKLAIRVNKPPTNCYIGKDRQAAGAFFEALKKVNYTSGFRLSIDPYHNGKIPIAWVAAFIAEYKKYFKLSSLTIGSSFHDREKIFALYEELRQELAKLGIWDFKIIKEKKGIFIEGQKIKYGIWTPTRPSWQPLGGEEVEMEVIDKTFACLGPLGVGYLWVEPDLKTRVCSCNGNGFLDFYIMGDLSKENIKEIIDRAGKNRIFRILANYGSAGLRKVLNLKAKVLAEDKKYTFMCELCNEIIGNKKWLEIIDKNAEQAGL
jgi:organic radical activating enzyme